MGHAAVSATQASDIFVARISMRSFKINRSKSMKNEGVHQQNRLNLIDQ